MAQNSKRGRNNNRRRQGGSNNLNRSMDSTGPEVKIRGTAMQIYDKYQALARDAISAGDRIRGESLQQHAEHYYRMMRQMQASAEQHRERTEDRSERSEPKTDSAVDMAATTTATTEEAVKPDESASVETASGQVEEKRTADAPDSEGEASRPRRTRRRRTRKDAGSDEGAPADSDSKKEESAPAA
ncbi:MAG: DUF4167 domain-containing protein [Pseudomonadota bacterium]